MKGNYYFMNINNLDKIYIVQSISYLCGAYRPEITIEMCFISKDKAKAFKENMQKIDGKLYKIIESKIIIDEK